MTEPDSLLEVSPSGMMPLWLRGAASAVISKLEIDRAVAFLIAARVVQMAAFPITLLVIVRALTPEVQGFYYTFSSIIALQMFVELGYTFVIVNVASHEWSHLSLDANGFIVGDPEALSRLVSLGRLVVKWYAVMAAIFIAGSAVAGFAFFSREGHPNVHWQGPLLALVAVSGLLLWALPLNSLLEGCNQVGNINKLRLTQTLLESVTLWAVLLLGGGLWAAAAAVFAKVLRDLYLLFVQYRNFFRPFLSLRMTSRVDWSTEIWPMQWRLALAAVATYFGSALYNPVMFHYKGAVVAGRMGMTLQIVIGLQLVPMAWVLTKAPQYGMLIAQKAYDSLDRLWRRNSLISIAVMVLGGAVVWTAVYVMNRMRLPAAQRILPPAQFALFLAGAVMLQGCQCFAAYLRAHKREPILMANITTALLGGALVFALGSRIGALGGAIAYATQMLLSVIWIGGVWHRSRRLWHA
jgi:hypothetical protein